MYTVNEISYFVAMFVYAELGKRFYDTEFNSNHYKTHAHTHACTNTHTHIRVLLHIK